MLYTVGRKLGFCPSILPQPHLRRKEFLPSLLSSPFYLTQTPTDGQEDKRLTKTELANKKLGDTLALEKKKINYLLLTS